MAKSNGNIHVGKASLGGPDSPGSKETITVSDSMDKIGRHAPGDAPFPPSVTANHKGKGRDGQHYA
jgi:hypothetical protein